MKALEHTHAIRSTLSDPLSLSRAIADAVVSEVPPVDTIAMGLDALASAGPAASSVVRPLQEASDALGCVALALSGGASLGFFHMGVIKALHDNDALPDLISGSSIGAMVAAGIAVRDDDELDTLFRELHTMRRDGIAFGGWRRLLTQGSLLCTDQLRGVLEHNIGDWTFAEAHAHTGRTLALTVSPTRPGMGPRLLTHRNAPDTTVLDTVLASSALPGLFAPTPLRVRSGGGPAVPTAERWADGSLRFDIPRESLVAEHNAGVVVASQTNLHVLPFAAGGRLMRRLGKGGKTARHLLRIPRRLTERTPIGPSVHHLHDLVAQNYGGDIDIVPRLRPRAVARVVRNPTLDELRAYIEEGERATLPQLPAIQRALRIRRTLNEGLIRLSAASERAAK